MLNPMKIAEFKFLPAALMLVVILLVNGCVSAGGVFNSGIWIGAVLALLGVGLVFWIISKISGGGGGGSSSNV